ncbi:exodeoxyribonuclease VII large subunit [Lichenibacterium dinghuense]|uniref:exodeoxyribonuclease VII large subunit n=1 Tax=Lichenibacterium dinghuense TaxID=2895977 RepID=UPI001F31D010|nr:exodeoxyribonuclease VII large subunit [Lichenibacterium sp. 6Y81]
MTGRSAAREIAPRPSPAPIDGGPPAPGLAGAVPLGDLLRRASAAIRTGLPDAVWVVAAVAACKPARGGCSLELVEPEVSRAEAGVLRAYLPDAVLAALRERAGHAVDGVDLVGMTVTSRLAVELSPRWGLSGRVQALAPGLEASLARRALEATMARLRRDGSYDRQRGLARPRDVTRVAVVHPAGAAGWADVAGELARWQAAGLLAVRSVPTAFEGPGAAAGIAVALGRAAEDVAGGRPDLVLVVRGGGAASSLAPFDDEAVARAVAALPVPVLCGLGHAVDLTLADRVCWRSADTPSKTLTVLRELMAAPSRRARADYGAVLLAVAAGLDRAGPALAAAERRVATEATRRAVATSEALDRTWGAVRTAAEGARGRLTRQGDALDRLASDAAGAAPVRLDRSATELAALMEAVRARARRASAGADGGAGLLAVAVARGQALVATAEVGLAARGRELPDAAAAVVARASTSLNAGAERVRFDARARLGRADDGARALAGVAAAVSAAHRRQDAALERSMRTVEASAARQIDAAASALDRHTDVLDAAEPSHMLQRGYALVTDASGRPVTSAAAARAAASVTLTFADGAIAVRLHQPTTGDQP